MPYLELCFQGRQLRRLSTILDEDSRAGSCRVSMETELWSWGLNAKGQLGLGDMIERYVHVSAV